MTPTNLTLNDKPAAVTTRDRLNFISTTKPRPQQKERKDDLHHDGVRVHL